MSEVWQTLLFTIACYLIAALFAFQLLAIWQALYTRYLIKKHWKPKVDKWEGKS